MTELMKASQLLEAATTQLLFVPRKPALAMEWTVDEATGRAVSQWVAVDQDAYSFFSEIIYAV